MVVYPAWFVLTARITPNNPSLLYPFGGAPFWVQSSRPSLTRVPSSSFGFRGTALRLCAACHKAGWSCRRRSKGLSHTSLVDAARESELRQRRQTRLVSGVCPKTRGKEEPENVDSESAESEPHRRLPFRVSAWRLCGRPRHGGRRGRAAQAGAQLGVEASSGTPSWSNKGWDPSLFWGNTGKKPGCLTWTRHCLVEFKKTRCAGLRSVASNAKNTCQSLTGITIDQYDPQMVPCEKTHCQKGSSKSGVKRSPQPASFEQAYTQKGLGCSTWGFPSPYSATGHCYNKGSCPDLPDLPDWF